MVRFTRSIGPDARSAALRVGLLLGLIAAATAALTVSAWAAEPHPWQLGFQPPATPVKERIHWLHNDILLPIITAITIFVLGLMLYVMWRFRASRNPVPTRTAHNTVVEVLWTVVPVVILVVIAIPSFRLMYYMDRVPDADMTIKVIGHQWYWTYNYPDHGDLQFDSNIIPDKDLKPGQKRLLEVDNPLVVPTGANVRVLISGTDVMHSWFIPSFGVQFYAMPGRTNETWFRVERPGSYYGECNQICGVNHAFMPIKVVAVPRPEFDRWLGEAKKKFAGAAPEGDRPAQATTVAAAGGGQPAGN